MSDIKKYPIAEIFTSPQGEGQYTGTLMTFIRTAGCTVGRKFPKDRYTEVPHCEFKCEGGDPDVGHNPNCTYLLSKKNLLPIYTEMCTTYDGRTFECDTDYRMKEKLTAEEIMGRVPEGVRHICITGGEPFMHDLSSIIGVAHERHLRVHIETSGKEEIPEQDAQFCWITVSPKLGVRQSSIDRANEIKLLVDEGFDISKVPEAIMSHRMVYIQPINYENAINRENMKRVLALQHQFPHWKISTQMHKIWEVR